MAALEKRLSDRQARFEGALMQVGETGGAGLQTPSLRGFPQC